MIITPSELILNEDNSIYHLCLHPSDLASTVITVGDPSRVDLIAERLDDIYLTKHNREFKTITGRIGHKDLTIISTGIGTDNIDIVLNELDALVNVDLDNRTIKEKHTKLKFIRIGTSGSIQADINIDSFIISQYAVGLDGLLSYYDSTQVRDLALEKACIELKGYAVAAEKTLLETFTDLGEKGITITSNGFYGPQGRSIRLKFNNKLFEICQNIRYQNLAITNLEMETAGLYGMAKLLGHEAISLNAILANRITKEFSKTPAKTIEKLIDDSLRKISILS